MVTLHYYLTDSEGFVKREVMIFSNPWEAIEQLAAFANAKWVHCFA